MQILASERLSPHKYKTSEGYLICTDAILARTGKQEYRRAELFGDSCENADEIVDVDRKPEEVFAKETIASFENKPIVVEHPDEDVNAENYKQYAVGFVRDVHQGNVQGNDVLLGTLVITDAKTIEEIENGEHTDLSCGYDCDIEDNDNPQQKRIRGNHVALCEQGRAGIAKIVDSVKDTLVSANALSVGMRINYRGKVYTVENVVQNALYSGEYDLTLKADDGSRRVLETGGSDRFTVVDSTKDFAVMRFDFSTNIAAFERAIINNDVAEFNAMLPTFEKDIADYCKWKAEGKLSAADIGKVKRQIDKINNLLVKSKINKRFEVKDMAVLKDDEYVQLPRGRFKLVAKTKEELEKEGYGYHHSDNGYSVYVKNNSAVAIKDAAHANDANYEQWTKQGYRVAALYKDGGRIHAIVERKSGDFVVALGYNTSTGEWAQGRYVSTFGAAVNTLNEEKPGAVPIRDAKTTKKTFEVSFVKDNATYIYKVKADSLQDAMTHNVERTKALGLDSSKKVFSEEEKKAIYNRFNQVRKSHGLSPLTYPWQAYKDEMFTLWKEYLDELGVKDSLKLYKVSYEKDGVTYIHKFKADSLQDAIRKAKDEVSTAHKVVVFTRNILSEMGKNNSIGKYDRVISAMQSLYGQSLLPDDKLKEVIRRELPRLLKKYVNE